MSLPNDLTPSQLGRLAWDMQSMDDADLITLAMHHPARLRAVALSAAIALCFMPPDDDPPPDA
jgi:hypothetical protein